jgi:hypothetical protein
MYQSRNEAFGIAGVAAIAGGRQESGGLAATDCVLSQSSVADGYLWQGFIRLGSNDAFPKRLRADTVARFVKLALSYRDSAPKPAVPARRWQEVNRVAT